MIQKKDSIWEGMGSIYIPSPQLTQLIHHNSQAGELETTKSGQSGIWCQTGIAPLVIHALLVGIEASMGTPCRLSVQVELRLGAR